MNEKESVIDGGNRERQTKQTEAFVQTLCLHILTVSVQARESKRGRDKTKAKEWEIQYVATQTSTNNAK